MRAVLLKINSNVYLLKNTNSHYLLLNDTLIPLYDNKISHFCEGCFSYYTLLTDEISLPDCLYLLRYWSICILKLFVNQVVTS